MSGVLEDERCRSANHGRPRACRFIRRRIRVNGPRLEARELHARREDVSEDETSLAGEKRSWHSLASRDMA
jgi:hypothetical protein